jgi:hypothetical protein
VAEALEQESSRDPNDTSLIVSTQISVLMQEIDNENQTQDEQDREITDQSILDGAAITLLSRTVNTEIQSLSATMDSSSGTVALRGLLSYIQVVYQRPVRLTQTQFADLVDAQVRRRAYSAAVVAAALQAAGVTNASESAVHAASDQQRGQLPSFALFGSGISAFEAFGIGASQIEAGGFQLDQSTLDVYLQQVLHH